MMFRFGGINLYSLNPEATEAFYRKLGLTVMRPGDPESKWYGAELALEDGKQEPILWIWRSVDGYDPVHNYMVFRSDVGLDVLYARIREAGIQCDPPFTAVWGGRELILQDPDGNDILFL